MNIISINVDQGECMDTPLLIGYAGENNIDAVDFDFTAWVTAYGEGQIYLEIMRAKDTTPYLAILAVDGTVARWTISDVDTAKHGPGLAQLVYQPTRATKKSAIYKFFVGNSLTEPGRDDPWGPIIERMEEILAEVKEQAAAADQSAQDASGSAEDAEALAVGERGGEPVPETDPAYENNAKYYADEAGKTVRTFTETTAPAAVQAVNTEGQTQVQAVNTAGAAKVQDVNTAGQTALTAVSGAQTAAVNAITQKSTEEQAAIQQKGEEVIASIPSDYTDLSDEVDDLKSALSDQIIYVFPQEYIDGGYFDRRNPECAITQSSSWCTTDKIPITNGVIRYKGLNGIGTNPVNVYYDSNGNFLKPFGFTRSVDNWFTIIPPTDAAFAAFSLSNADKSTFEMHVDYVQGEMTNMNTLIDAGKKGTINAIGGTYWTSDALYYEGVARCYYVGYVDNTGWQGVISIDADTKKITRTPLYKVSVDDHNSMGVAIRNDGRVVAIGTSHASTHKHQVFISDNPEDISTFNKNIVLGTDDDGWKTYSYILKCNNKYFLFWRENEGSESPYQWSWKFRETSDFETWSEVHTLVTAGTTQYYAMPRAYNSDYIKFFMQSNATLGNTEIRLGYLNISTYDIYDGDLSTVLGNALTSGVLFSDFTIIKAPQDNRKLRLEDALSGEDNTFLIADGSSGWGSYNNFLMRDNGSGWDEISLGSAGTGYGPTSYVNTGALIDKNNVAIPYNTGGHWEMRKYTVDSEGNVTYRTIMGTPNANTKLLKPKALTDEAVLINRGYYSAQNYTDFYTAIHIASISEDYTDLSDEVNDLKGAKAPVIIDATSGAIASFEDGADGMPIKSLTVNIEPVQDLHGYDNPWPAGGGKNKFDISRMANTSDITISNGVIIVTGNAKNSEKTLGQLTDLIVGESYILTANITSSENIIYLYGTGANVSWTFGTSKTITQEMLDATVFFYGGNSTTSRISNFMIRLASVTDATFAPYSNICPISGWTGCNVTRAGENLCDGATLSPNKSFSDDNGTTVNSPVSDIVQNIDALGGETYIFSFDYVSLQAVNARRCMWYDAGNNPIVGRYTYTPSEKNAIFTAPLNAVKLSITVDKGCFDFQLYLQRDVTTKSITFPTEAGTVYGGTLTINADGSGELMVTHAIVSYDKNDTWTKYYGFYARNKARVNSASQITNGICNYFKVKTSATETVGFNAVSVQDGDETYFVPRFYYDGVNTVEEWINYLAENNREIQVAYLLNSPIPYQLTAQQITTLLGQNNIWADCGDVTVEYPADTKLYIQKINAPSDDDMVADAQIASGKYFIIGNNLYLSTTTIPAGDAIIPGTNCTQTNLAEALNALNT